MLDKFVEGFVFAPLCSGVEWIMNHRRAKYVALSVFFACLIIAFFPQIFYGQADNNAVRASVEPPDAPTPSTEGFSSSTMPPAVAEMLSAGMTTQPPRPKKISKAEKIEGRIADVTLWGGLVTDMIPTGFMVTHKREATFNATCTQLMADPFYERVFKCSPSSVPITMNVTLYDPWFTEGGWGRITGNRNAAGIILFNTSLDLGVWTVCKIFSGNKQLRTIGHVFKTEKGLEHIKLGIENMKYIHSTEWEFVPRGATNINWH